jgi:hypothetical protein
LIFVSCAPKSNGAIGSACKTDKDCTAPLGCFDAPFPAGTCSSDCSADPCAANQVCALVGDRNLCLAPCIDKTQCRDGWQCFGGGCTAPCAEDPECGPGFQCLDGECKPFDGAAVGEPCTIDMECSSRMCVKNVCAQACNRDALCPTGQTCTLNVSDKIQPACTARRSTGAPGAACTSDTQCDRGSCQLGVCVELCATTQDCHGSGMTCAKMFAPLDDGNGTAPQFNGCLPRVGILQFTAPLDVVPLPSNVQSMAIYAKLNVFDFSTFVGVTGLKDPQSAALYAQPATPEEFFTLKIRYQPDESTSTMLVPNSPAVVLGPGAYPYTAGTSKTAAFFSDVYLKLGDTPPSSGRLPLNFYVTNLSGACANVTAANGATVLASFINEIKQILGQAGLTVTSVNFKSTGASPTVRRPADGQQDVPDLHNVLLQATANQGTTAGLDVVLVRSITDVNGQPIGILGVAGGIPSSPELGTPHSGAIVSIGTACGTNPVFSETTSHELGHTLGLFHNVEQKGQTDSIPDTGTEGSNLMYWVENQGTVLSAQQAQVIRNDMKVKP